MQNAEENAIFFVFSEKNTRILHALGFKICKKCRFLLDQTCKKRYYCAMIRERIKNWLRETKTSRKELAGKLLVSPSTLDGWLLKANPRPIPIKKYAAIEALMAQKDENGEIPLTLTFTKEEIAALKEGLPPDADLRAVLRERLIAFVRAARIGH
jgi:transcriptional regulator with XRE-family HTH domain